jgi:hypothetical protein
MNTTSRLCVLGCFVIALSWWLATPVAAAVSKDNRARAAKKACLSGDYAKGVGLLAELYVDTNDPMFIFNQGRCFEQNGRYEDAVTRFREYQRKLVDAGRASDPEADRHVTECSAMLEKQKASNLQGRSSATSAEVNVAPSTEGVARDATKAPPSASPPAPTYSPEVALEKSLPQSPVPAAPATVPGGGEHPLPPEDASMPIQKELGYGAGALGILGLGTGLAAYLLARSYLDDASGQGCTGSSCEGPGRSQYESAQTALLVCNIAAVSGGILLVGGLVLVLTSPSPSHAPRSVALVPVMGPGMGQLALVGRF